MQDAVVSEYNASFVRAQFRRFNLSRPRAVRGVMRVTGSVDQKTSVFLKY